MTGTSRSVKSAVLFVTSVARSRRAKAAISQVGVVVRPSVSTPIRPKPCGLHPHCPVVDDPLKRAGKGVQLLELTIRPAVTEAAPQLVEDNWA